MQGEAMPIELHDGSRIVLRKVRKGLQRHATAVRRSSISARITARGEIVTGLLYIDESEPDMHASQRHDRGAAEPAALRERFAPGPKRSRSCRSASASSAAARGRGA